MALLLRRVGLRGESVSGCSSRPQPRLKLVGCKRGERTWVLVEMIENDDNLNEIR
jgi:hypothetical protein